MSNKYIDKKTLEKVLKKWENAKKTNYATSAFWQSEKDKLSKLVGKKAKSGSLISGVSRLTKTQSELLNRELNIIANSKLSTKSGYQRARRKQRETLIAKKVFKNNKEALKFQKIISSDVFQKIADNLSYMNYLQAMQFTRNPQVTVKKIENAWNKVEKMEFENDNEKASYFMSLLSGDSGKETINDRVHERNETRTK